MPQRKIKLYIKIFIIIVLLGLIIGVYLNGKNLSPDKCIVKFKSQSTIERWSGNDFDNNISIKLTELYEELKNGKCRVIWDRTQGYMLA